MSTKGQSQGPPLEVSDKRIFLSVYVDTSRNMTVLQVKLLWSEHVSMAGLILAQCVLADINPIGAISKTDLKKFIAYAKDAFDLPVLTRYGDRLAVKSLLINLMGSFLDAVPTAELEPITETYVQADEVRTLISFIVSIISIFSGARLIWGWPMTNCLYLDGWEK